MCIRDRDQIMAMRKMSGTVQSIMNLYSRKHAMDGMRIDLKMAELEKELKLSLIHISRNREKLAGDDWVMAEFYATWCPHCQRMQPLIKEFKKEMEGIVEVVQVDVDEESDLANFYTIESTPTFILFRKGEQLWRQSGELTLERLGRAVKEFKS